MPLVSTRQSHIELYQNICFRREWATRCGERQLMALSEPQVFVIDAADGHASPIAYPS